MKKILVLETIKGLSECKYVPTMIVILSSVVEVESKEKIESTIETMFPNVNYIYGEIAIWRFHSSYNLDK